MSTTAKEAVKAHLSKYSQSLATDLYLESVLLRYRAAMSEQDLCDYTNICKPSKDSGYWGDITTHMMIYLTGEDDFYLELSHAQVKSVIESLNWHNLLALFPGVLSYAGDCLR